MFKYGQSYKTVTPMAAFDHAAAPQVVPNGQQFECRSKLDDLPGQVGVRGYKIRSNGVDYYVEQAVADAAENTYWQRLASPSLNRANAQGAISDWDVGEGLQNGGHMTGFGDRKTDLKTTVKWGAPVPSIVVPDASWMEATILGPDHPVGSEPGGDGLKNAQQLTAATGVQWIGGHLLNHNLGGPGTDVRNIAAIPGKNTNTLHSSQVEEDIKTHINRTGGFAYYRVDVTHESREVPAANGIPKGNHNIASSVETKWQKLDVDGLPIGNLVVDRFPIPRPTEIAGKPTTPDHRADWHAPQATQSPPQGTGDNAATHTGTFLGHPTSEPLTCKLDDYPQQGRTTLPTAFPNQRYLSPSVLKFFAENILMNVKRTPTLLVRTESTLDTLENSAFEINDGKRKGEEDPYPLEKKAKKNRPEHLRHTEDAIELRRRLVDRIVRDVQANPEGSRARLARGWSIHLEVSKNTPAYQQDPSMEEEECYDEYTRFIESGSRDFDEWLYDGD